jgi:hypothetical protein
MIGGNASAARTSRAACNRRRFFLTNVAKKRLSISTRPKYEIASASRIASLEEVFVI